MGGGRTPLFFHTDDLLCDCEPRDVLCGFQFFHVLSPLCCRILCRTAAELQPYRRARCCCVLLGPS